MVDLTQEKETWDYAGGKKTWLNLGSCCWVFDPTAKRTNIHMDQLDLLQESTPQLTKAHEGEGLD